jgi:hypothetical protein
MTTEALSITDILAVVFGITATILGVAAVVATLITRDRRHFGTSSSSKSQIIY